MCSGRVYYDLLERRRAEGLDYVAIIRIEQLYPFPWRLLRKELAYYTNVKEYCWCQEEPKNMGGWNFVEPNIEWVLDQIGAQHKRAVYAGRPSSAATATGLMSKHKAELEAFTHEALVG